MAMGICAPLSTKSSFYAVFRRQNSQTTAWHPPQTQAQPILEIHGSATGREAHPWCHLLHPLMPDDRNR